ncbi:hypothetical protein ABZV67_46475, partial [Streptomyces sp. NPDC005065]|uniref:hypothetical protein n=1 Tax=unclassified Streptomyces TaxID=2593676 RepID=UPI00339F7DC2
MSFGGSWSADGRRCNDSFVVADAEWARIRRGLHFGQVFEGTVAKVPRPGAIGIFVDIGLSVGGFVDVLLLPAESEDWPAEGAVADFEIWWADSRKQIPLKPSDSRYLRSDFTAFVERWRGRRSHSRSRIEVAIQRGWAVRSGCCCVRREGVRDPWPGGEEA